MSTDPSLPVELSSFSAEAVQDVILFKWTTESETNNLGYILERSVGADGHPPGDATGWQTIASYQTHPALAGQGNTSQQTDYEYLDITTLSGTYILRLIAGDVIKSQKVLLMR